MNTATEVIKPDWALSVCDVVQWIGRAKFSEEWTIDEASSEELHAAYIHLLKRLASGHLEAVACFTHTGDFYAVKMGRWLDADALQWLKDQKIRMRIGHGAAPCRLLIRKDGLVEPASFDSVGTPPARPRGVRATKTPAILEKMRRMDQGELEGLSGKEMAARFGAARSTCEAARKKVRLARIADK